MGLELLDLLTDDILMVHDESAPEMLEVGDIMSVVIYRAGDMHLIDFNVTRLGRGHGAQVIKEVTAQAQLAGRDPAKEAEYLSNNPFVFAKLVDDLVAKFSILPKLLNFDGEDFIFGRAEYAVDNPAKTTTFFAGRSDFPDSDKADFDWVEESAENILGTVHVKANILTFEANSIKCLDQFDALVNKELADALSVKGRVIQNIEQALADFESLPSSDLGEEDKLDPLVEKEILETFLNQHYADWLDEPLPALSDETPRLAVRTDEGRKLVTALIDDIATAHAADPGSLAPRPDIDGIRRDLGLINQEPV